MMSLEKICQLYKISNGHGIDIHAGTLHLHVRRISMGWGFKVENELSDFADVDVRENNSVFQVSESALFQTGKDDRLLIMPALPPKPVVLKNSGIRILQGQSMRFFVKIPLWLQFYRSEFSAENFITEYPLFRLSDTWFGEPDDGEPAFALGNYYQKEISLLNAKSWEAICPVNISNHSNTMLEIQRFIIRVDNLALVSVENQIMTSLTDIEYKGKEQISSATYSLNNSVHGDHFRQIAQPRVSGNKSLLKINFHFIKNIYQF